MPRMYQWTPDECIPEYFSDASVFVSQHENMEDISLPAWCSEPEAFIRWHRSMLESDYVSNHLHLWINLNFGCVSGGCVTDSYQLSGEAAIEAKNVPLVQEGVKGLTKNPGFVQLFTHPHPQRMYNGRGELIFKQVSTEARQDILDAVGRRLHSTDACPRLTHPLLACRDAHRHARRPAARLLTAPPCLRRRAPFSRSDARHVPSCDARNTHHTCDASHSNSNANSNASGTNSNANSNASTGDDDDANYYGGEGAATEEHEPAIVAAAVRRDA